MGALETDPASTPPTHRRLSPADLPGAAPAALDHTQNALCAVPRAQAPKAVLACTFGCPDLHLQEKLQRCLQSGSDTPTLCSGPRYVGPEDATTLETCKKKRKIINTNLSIKVNSYFE